MTLTIISREAWGARPPKQWVGDTAHETFLHHSAGAHSGAAGVRSIQRFHQDVRGWADIAYNFLIDPDTLGVFEGRGWGVRPGSQKSYNTGTWSVCVLGNFQTETPTQGLLETVAGLIRFGHEIGEIPLTLSGGHRDAPGQSTTCPGDRLHREIPTIRNLLEADMLTPHEEEVVKRIVAELDAIGSDGSFAKYTVLHLRNHPTSSGSVDSTARSIATAARDRLNTLLGHLRRS